jgi:hypothetical protein
MLAFDVKTWRKISGSIVQTEFRAVGLTQIHGNRTTVGETFTLKGQDPCAAIHGLLRHETTSRFKTAPSCRNSGALL